MAIYLMIDMLQTDFWLTYNNKNLLGIALPDKYT